MAGYSLTVKNNSSYSCYCKKTSAGGSTGSKTVPAGETWGPLSSTTKVYIEFNTSTQYISWGGTNYYESPKEFTLVSDRTLTISNIPQTKTYSLGVNSSAYGYWSSSDSVTSVTSYSISGNKITFNRSEPTYTYVRTAYENNGYEFVDITVSGTRVQANFKKAKYTTTLNGNGGYIKINGVNYTEWPISKENGDTIQLGSYSPTRASGSKDLTYTMNFYLYNGGSLYDTKSISGGKETTSYTHTGWKSGSNPSESYGTGVSYKVTKTDSLLAQWNTTTTSTESKLQSVPSTPSRTGYTFLKWMCDGSEVKAGTVYSSNKNAYGTWEAKKYNINYELRGANAKWPDSGKPDSQEKTYGTSIYATNVVPTRFGYTFKGWHSNADVARTSDEIIPPGGVLDDRFFNDSTKVTLYSIWVPINQTCTYHYYDASGKEQTYNETYNIETENPYEGKAPSYSRGEDWVFLGWVKRDPNDAEWKSTWLSEKGVYRNPDKAPSDYTLPYEIYVDKIKEWNKDTVTHLYGFWTITGKYVNIKGEWKKVAVAYINKDGNWIPMAGNNQQTSSFSVNVKGQWKEEVH